jgi:hypothetical protein
MKFNLNGLNVLYGDDFKTKLSWNCWNGRISATVFFENDNKPYITSFENGSLFVLKTLINTIQKDTTAGVSGSMVISFFNRDTKQRETGSVVTIARDDRGLAYMSLSNQNWPKKAKFYFKIGENVSLELTGKVFDEAERNRHGLKAFVNFLNSELVVAKLISRDSKSMADSLAKWKASRDNNNSSASTTTDDISF